MNLYQSINIGSLELDGNLFLAPVAGYTDRAFRSLCVEQGANFSFTELISAEAISRRAAVPPCEDFPYMVRRADNEKHYAIQLFGANPESIYKAAVLLAPLRPDAIDINAGCPVPKVIKNGAGSALMKNPANLGRIVEAAVRASHESLDGVPVTIKIRSGWDSQSLNYAECARIAVEAGAAMVSLHCRTRAQGYGGKGDRSHIADLVTRIQVPVTGSGDLYTPEDAKQMLEETNCAAIMFARGAMGNPFIFSQVRSFLETGSWETTSFEARIAIAIRHLEMLAADVGERTACLEMRKQFCSYTKGIVRGAALRERVVHASTIAEYKDIVKHEFN